MALGWLILALPVMACIAMAILFRNGLPIFARSPEGKLVFSTHRLNSTGRPMPTRMGLWLTRHNLQGLPSLLEFVTGSTRLSRR